MFINPTTKVSDVITSNIKAADIFSKYGIDFCCGGGVSLEKACAKINVDLQLLLDDLQHLSISTSPSQDYRQWSPAFLADYIVNTHHAYVREALPLLREYIVKVAKVHADGYPDILQIRDLFFQLHDEFIEHMYKEEKVLFPYIHELVKKGQQLPRPSFGSVANPIAMMRDEHESAGEIMHRIAILSTQYMPPEWACNTFRALFAKLDEFEKDLHIHVHLENNILFPAAMLIEGRNLHYN